MGSVVRITPGGVSYTVNNFTTSIGEPGTYAIADAAVTPRHADRAEDCRLRLHAGTLDLTYRYSVASGVDRANLQAAFGGTSTMT